MTTRRLRSVPDGASPLRAGLYVRVSALMGREGEEFRSPDLQLAAMRRFIATRNMVEVATWQDLDRSGRTFQREGIEAAFAAVRAGEVDVLVVLDLSRFGRNTSECLRRIRELRDLGVPVVSTVEQIDDSPEGQFTLGMFLGMHQLYSDRVSRQWQQVHAAIHEQGGWLGQVPIGYRRTGPRVIEPDPDTAPAVREAFAAYAAGASATEVVRRLRALTGQARRNNSLLGMLRNPVYIGQVRSTTRGTVHPGRHERLIDDETWERVQARMRAASYTPKRSLTPQHPWVGLVNCDECGHPMARHITQTLSDGRQVLRLRCSMKVDGLCPGAGSPTSEDLEQVVLAWLRDYLVKIRTDDATRAAARSRVTRAKLDIKRLRAELKALRDARATLGVDLGRRILTPADYQAAIAAIDEQERDIEAVLATQEAAAGNAAPRQARQAIERLLELWGPATMPERNRMLRDVLREIRIRPAASWRQPLVQRVLIDPL